MSSSTVVSDNNDVDPLEALGGREAVLEMFEKHRAISADFWSRYYALLEQYPDQWIAWGENGFIATADSQLELIAKLEHKGLTPNDVVLEFLDTDPKVLIL